MWYSLLFFTNSTQRNQLSFLTHFAPRKRRRKGESRSCNGYVVSTGRRQVTVRHPHGRFGATSRVPPNRRRRRVNSRIPSRDRQGRRDHLPPDHARHGPWQKRSSHPCKRSRR